MQSPYILLSVATTTLFHIPFFFWNYDIKCPVLHLLLLDAMLYAKGVAITIRHLKNYLGFGVESPVHK